MPPDVRRWLCPAVRLGWKSGYARKIRQGRIRGSMNGISRKEKFLLLALPSEAPLPGPSPKTFKNIPEGQRPSAHQTA
jgi:hypothetical protein